MSLTFPMRLPWPVELPGPAGAIWICPADRRSLRTLTPWLTGRDRTAARRFRQMERRDALLIGRGLLRYALSQQQGMAIRPWQFRLQPNRRPLHRRSPWTRRLALSISHTPRWVAVAWVPGAQLGTRIGLDLEEAGRAIDTRVAARLPWPVDRSTPLLLASWTRAEAALKADGRGLAALSRLQGHAPATLTTDLFRIRTASLAGLPGFPAPVGAVALARPFRRPDDSGT